MKEPAQIYVIVDTSAGYKADGKANLMRNSVRSLMSAARKGFFADCSFRFFTWAGGLDEFSDPEQLSFAGSADMAALISTIEDADCYSRFLLLSDGIVDGKGVDAAVEILERKKSVLIPVAVGPDAYLQGLGRLAAPVKYCYQCVNLLSALHEICFRDFYRLV